MIRRSVAARDGAPMGFGGVIGCGHGSGGGVVGWRGRFNIQTGNGRGFHVLKKGGGNKRDKNHYTY